MPGGSYDPPYGSLFESFDRNLDSLGYSL